MPCYPQRSENSVINPGTSGLADHFNLTSLLLEHLPVGQDPQIDVVQQEVFLELVLMLLLEAGSL